MSLLQSQGFGFVVLFNAKESREIKSAQDAVRFGTSQAKTAAKIARQEGFLEGTVIFLDVEEGGRLPDLYHVYLQSWYDALAKVGFHAGVYCSGIPVDEGAGGTHRYCRRYSRPYGHTRFALLGLQRCLPTLSRLHFANEPSRAFAKRNTLCLNLAVRALSP